MTGCQYIGLMVFLIDSVNDKDLDILKFVRVMKKVYPYEYEQPVFYIPTHIYEAYFQQQLEASFPVRNTRCMYGNYLPDLQLRPLEDKEDKKNIPWFVKAEQKGGSKRRKPFIK